MTVSRSEIRLVLLSLALVVASCSQDPKRHIESGKKYFGEKKYSEAIIEFRTASRASQRSADAHYQLGRCYLAVGEFVTGMNELENAVSQDPNLLQAQLGIGNLLLLNRKFVDAQARAELILKKDPKNIRAKILYANSRAGIIGLNESIEEILLGLQREPRLLPSHLDLGGDQNARRSSVEDYYQSAVTGNERSVEAWLALEGYYLISDHFGEAEKAVKSALAIDPKSRDALGALGFLYLREKKFDLAEQAFLKLCDDYPQDQGQRLILADVYVAAGKSDRAID